MITVICATHRPKNQTYKVVHFYESLLRDLGQEVNVLEMNELPSDFVISDSFGKRNQTTDRLIDEKLKPADRLVIVSPEYNGSFPGVFKAFLDGVKPGMWKGKKVALVGVASGRAGNLRGMDHLTDVLHHLRMEVFSFKVPISRLDDLIDEREGLIDEATQAVLKRQAEEFLSY